MLKLTISDYSRYDPRRCRNGGGYGYVEKAFVEQGRVLFGYYWTTSELPYCTICGRFEQRLEDHVDRFHDGSDDDYQASLRMQHAIELLNEHGAQAAIKAFNQWAGEGVTLEIEQVPGGFISRQDAIEIARIMMDLSDDA